MIVLTPPYHEGRLRLKDGRWLSYAEFGDAEGEPIFWFHGAPGSRTQLPPATDREARRLHLRIVGVDRPGLGESTNAPERSFLSFADDVEQLADHLAFSSFGLIGLSGGGPYVLASAYRLGPRVAFGVSLGGPAPIFDPDPAPGYGWFVHAVGPRLASARLPLIFTVNGVVRCVRWAVHPILEVLKKVWFEADRALFQDGEFRRMLGVSILDASTRGLDGLVDDYVLFCQPWGFSVRDIQVPIRLWHGDRDPFVPLAHGRFLAGAIPNSHLEVVPGAGHFAGFSEVRDVLEEARRLFDMPRPTSSEGAIPVAPLAHA